MPYDMRDHLNPRRLTIAMWDTAYMIRRNPADPFKNWLQALDDLKERGFNTIRIDAFPGIIDPGNLDMEYTWPELNQPYMPWMWSHEYTGKPGRDLIEFIQAANKKGIYLTLSSWWAQSRIIPTDTMETADIWNELLRVIQREAGFTNILFVDLCNEIPGFLPGYSDQLKRAGEPGDEPGSGKQSANLAPVPGYAWSRAQMDFMKQTLDSSLAACQKEFPELRFTYSMNNNPAFEPVGFNNLDVLDIHFFITDPRFDTRTRFDEFIGDAYVSSTNFGDFSRRARKTIDAVGPMLRQKQRQQLQWAKGFSEEIGAPLITSEAWASWFYVDHPDLEWEWLLEWCEAAIDDAVEVGLWGITTNNYAEPHFKLWENIKWHQRLNEKFIRS